jgi:hypothetical protein
MCCKGFTVLGNIATQLIILLFLMTAHLIFNDDIFV